MQNAAGSFRTEQYHLTAIREESVPARRDFYKIWLIENKGILDLDDVSVDLDRPALVFLHPLVSYKFRAHEKNRMGFWCIFTNDFLHSSKGYSAFQYLSIFNSLNGSCFFPDKSTLGVIRFIFQQIVVEYNSGYSFKNDSLKNLTSLLIHEGVKLQPATPQRSQQNASTRLTMAFLNLMEKQYPIVSPQDPLRMKKPSEFAGQLAVHVNHLNAVVQQITGKSTSAHISDRMIQESKALLQYSDWPVADIAYSLGFDYPNHFTTFFKKHTGETPLSFRK